MAVYRTIGTNLFNISVQHGATLTHKHYDQQFRRAAIFPAYLAGPVILPTAPANLHVVR
jgi:hypothetical protein